MSTQRCLAYAVIPAAVLACLGMGLSLASAAGQDGTPAVRGAWQPTEQALSGYRDITDYNIFNADRRRIADRVDRERNPPEPQTPEVVDKPQAQPEQPPDPDTFYRLTGISHDPQGAVAYIEHTATGVLTRLRGPAAFSQGRVTVIGYASLVYVVDDAPRTIAVGQNLAGVAVAPLGAGGGAGPAPASVPQAIKPGSREAILQAMRERRAREYGTSTDPPPPGPQPDPVPDPEPGPAPPPRNPTQDAESD